MDKNSKFLLAMSGGVDSCVLFDLLLKSNFNFSVANANFGLRGKDSEEDEEFVKNLCDIHQIQFYSKKFNLEKIKQENNFSTQMAARKLRYDWFYKLLETKNLDFILTAHHLNDSVETFFINLTRGTGIRGLMGVPERNNKIYRPLLPFSKQAILDFAEKNKLKWKEDYTNAEVEYLRNKIRHKIVPEFEKINPDFYTNFQETILHLKAVEGIYNQEIQKFRNKIFKEKNGEIFIKIEKLNHLTNDFIFELFTSYKFNSVDEILKLKQAKTGAEIQSEKYRLLKDREFLILKPKEENSKKNTQITKNQEEINFPFPWKIEISETVTDNCLVIFDESKLKFPLSLRHFQTGDKFFPAGMNGKSKKVSKFFKDLKLSKFEKEKVWLLCDAENQILWIVNHRQDERFLPNENTSKCLIIKELH